MAVSFNDPDEWRERWKDDYPYTLTAYGSGINPERLTLPDGIWFRLAAFASLEETMTYGTRLLELNPEVAGNLCITIYRRTGSPIFCFNGALCRAVACTSAEQWLDQTVQQATSPLRARIQRARERRATQRPSTAKLIPIRRQQLVDRIVRSTARAKQVKAIHDDECQVCGERLETETGSYSEAAHIRPLGGVHGGFDDRSNILCLCPNHHVLFDRGGLVITESLQAIELYTGRTFKLRRRRRHPLDADALQYRREMFEGN
jgi:hypothetical protein